jgi:hypothetical protein
MKYRFWVHLHSFTVGKNGVLFEGIIKTVGVSVDKNEINQYSKHLVTLGELIMPWRCSISSLK